MSPPEPAAAAASDGDDRPDIRDRLIVATQRLAVERGLARLSLRAAAAAVGRSTTLVFQHFGSREALLQAALDHAVHSSAHDDARFAAQLHGLPRDAATLAGVLAFRVTQQGTDLAARFCQEVLFTPGHLPDAAPLLRRRDARQRAMWAALVADTRYACLADAIATYAVAEAGFATALDGHPGYALLLRESCAALFQGQAGTHDRDAPAGPVTRWLLERTVTAPHRQAAPAPAIARLLDHAVAGILQDGLSGLNLRALARRAQVAPSLVNYHYGDFASFTNEAIWRALLQGLPPSLDTAGPEPGAARQQRAWDEELRVAIRPGGAEGPAGFYVNYARILGQLALEAVRQPQFVPLLVWLRALEGAGIHHASHHAWPRSLALGRANAAAFAIWIKGRAILNEALGPHDAEPCDAPDRVAALIGGLPDQR